MKLETDLDDGPKKETMTAQTIADLRMIAGIGKIQARHVIDAIRKNEIRHLKWKPNRKKDR